MKLRIDWFITRICDQAKFCQFCYAPWNFFPPDVPIEYALRMCDRFKELGVESVTICGGEPFMYRGLDLIVKKLYSLGMKVVLYTSGTSDEYSVESFLPFLDFLSLPVDAVSPDVVERMRGALQFSRVTKILTTLRETPDRPRVKIGTVVTRVNIGDLAHIGDFLASFGIVSVWRLYEFSPYGIGKHNERRYMIDANEFSLAVVTEKSRNRQRESSMLISERSREENEGYCMIIDSGGSFYRYAEKYIPLGVTINDTTEQIYGCYDLDRHVRQKSWHE